MTYIHKFKSIHQQCREMYLQTERIKWSALPVVSNSKRKSNAKSINESFTKVEQAVKQEDMKVIDQNIQDWIRNDDVWNLSWLDEEEHEQFYDITKQFMRDARMFDDTLPFESITQALRNVWIVFILEKVFQKPLHYHKAIFAYSMLYPYTDNYLDDNSCDVHDKRKFNSWMDKRLKGLIHTYEHEREKPIHELISMIEKVYPREKFPQVYESLLLIQEGQKLSLLQAEKLSQSDLLDIAIWKGGASVLADAFLIDGIINDEEYHFSICFGFLLQIADDIQDIKDDQCVTHHTLVNIQKNKRNRKYFVERYLSFIHKVIDIKEGIDDRIHDFMIENCRLLVYFSLLNDDDLYPRMFLKRICKRMPLDIQDLKEIVSKATSFPNDSLKKLDEFLFETM